MIDPELARWGFDERFLADAGDLEGRFVGRIVTEDRLGYELVSASGEVRAVLPRKLRRAALAGETEKPAVGDWVVVQRRDEPGDAPIVSVVPRRTKLSRKAAGRDAVEQVVAANVDLAFLVTALDADLSVRRLERYRAICEEGGVRPIVVLTKSDLIDDPASLAREVAEVMSDVPVHLVSNVRAEGLRALDECLRPGVTVALVGSSGVGKSTLVNRWIGEVQATRAVREDGKGRHTTTQRSLFLTPLGGMVVDNPGMRELGFWDAEEGVRATFADVEAIAARCRFRDCAHEREPGCAVREALDRGELARERVESWRKLRREVVDRRAVQREGARTLRARLREKGR